jgi:hypothetical protein
MLLAAVVLILLGTLVVGTLVVARIINRAADHLRPDTAGSAGSAKVDLARVGERTEGRGDLDVPGGPEQTQHQW